LDQLRTVQQRLENYISSSQNPEHRVQAFRLDQASDKRPPRDLSPNISEDLFTSML